MKDGIDDPIAARRIREAADGPGASSDFPEAALDDVRRPQLHALGDGAVEKRQQLLQILAQARHGLRGETLDQVVRLPSSVTLEVQVGGAASSERQLVFRPTGSLVGRTVTLVLADRDKQQAVTVTGTTGFVSVQ